MSAENGGVLGVGSNALLGRLLRRWLFRLDEWDVDWLAVIASQDAPETRAEARKNWLAQRRYIWGLWHFILPHSAQDKGDEDARF